MNSPIIVVGIGEIGSVIARGFLCNSYPVYPVTRDLDMQSVAEEVPEPEAVVVAVGEYALQGILEHIPESWRSKLLLIQNELLPRDWLKHDLKPTVISVWFEKKKGQDVKIVVPSPIYGPKATLLANALDALDIPTLVLETEQQLTFELVRKNYYILTTNIAGLVTGSNVGDLWSNHRDVAQAVVNDVHQIQQCLVDDELNQQALLEAMLVAFEGDPEHQCMGRSAPARLERALTIAQNCKLEVPKLVEISQSLEHSS